MTEADNKRRFTRTHFDAVATLGNDESLWEVDVVDISLNGLLITRPQHWSAEIGEEFDFDLPLIEDEEFVVMKCKVARVDDKFVGLERTHIGIESITHLRKLLELNTGDVERINKEFSHLGLA